MNSQERRATFGLATLFAFRMLGLFMILPVFSLYAPQLKDATPELIGIAIGIYGLTQALLQIPLGALSDRWGRKPVIALGLGLFSVGSVIAALSHSIWGVIIGRALQGMGAIGSTIIAFLADLTLEENRTKAMAIIGLTIGLSFSLAMILGPLLNNLIQVAGIFWLTALLAIAGMVILHYLIPTPTKLHFHRDSMARTGDLMKVLRHPQLLILNLGIFFQHAILTAIFIVIPLIITQLFQISTAKQWLIYLPILGGSLFITIPFIILSEKKRLLKPLFIIAISLIALSQFNLAINYHSALNLLISLLLFFSAFNFLEASLPSLVSKLAPINNRGTAMGIYSSAQFLGIFSGGALGGWLYGRYHMSGIFCGCGIMALCWLLTALRTPKIPYLSTRIFKLTDIHLAQSTVLLAKLHATTGIEEVALDLQQKVVYLKVDTSIINDNQIQALLSGENHG